MNDGISPTPASREQAEQQEKWIDGVIEKTLGKYRFLGGYDYEDLHALARALLQEAEQKSDQVHFAANGDEAKSLQPLLHHPIDDLPPRMDIRSRPGDKIVFDANGGWPYEKVSAKAKLTLGAEYTISEIEVDRSSTKVWLVGQPQGYNNSFNSCLFAALGNRTPARQEERPDGNESAPAPLPVQGQEDALLKAAGFDLTNEFDRPDHPCPCSRCRAYFAAKGQQ